MTLDSFAEGIVAAALNPPAASRARCVPARMSEAIRYAWSMAIGNQKTVEYILRASSTVTTYLDELFLLRFRGKVVTNDGWCIFSWGDARSQDRSRFAR